MATQKEIETELTALRKQLEAERSLTDQTTKEWQAQVETMTAELAAFQRAAAEREATLKAACPPPESEFSLNLQFVGKVITGGQVTFRQTHAADWRIAFDEFAAMVKERDWKFAPAPEKPPERAKAAGEQIPENSDKSAAPPIKAYDAAETKAKTATFPASSLAATITDGKTYWKVKGGRFGKWGVTIWPETLDAAGFGALDPIRPYDLSGWTAEYIEKEGKPDKVVRLYK